MKSQWLVRLGQWMRIVLCWVFAGALTVEVAVPAEKYPAAADFPSFLEKIRAKFSTTTANLPEMSARMRRKERKNVIEFREYRKYSVEVKILNP